MKASADAKDFTQALNKVIKVLKQSPIPEMEGVLVQVKDKNCALTSPWSCPPG